MTRKQQRLAEKPVNLLTFAPDKGEKAGPNPFAPSPVRSTISKVFVKLEDLTERFEDWCQHGRSDERAVVPLGQRVTKWLSAPVARHAEEAEQQAQADGALVPARRWDGAVGEVIFRLRDRAGFVQRALAAQVRDLKAWVLQQTQSTQAEVDQLREQVSTQQAQMDTLTEQLQDLRALVTSQQQVLMYMGKDMDLAQAPTLERAMSGHAYRSQPSTRDRRESSTESTQSPYLNA